jgi:hypothetical protein
VLAVVVGVGVLALRPDQEARTTDREVPRSALPSKIDSTNVKIS